MPIRDVLCLKHSERVLLSEYNKTLGIRLLDSDRQSAADSLFDLEQLSSPLLDFRC